MGRPEAKTLNRSGLDWGLWWRWWWWKSLRKLCSRSMYSSKASPTPLKCLRSPEADKAMAGISLWRAGKGGSVVLSWGHEASEGSFGMPFLLLAPALSPLLAGA
jgi:hypothetical protein